MSRCPHCTPNPRRRRLLQGLGLGTGLGAGCALVPRALAGAAPATPLQLFPLSAVRLQGGPLLDAQQRGLSYLLALDPDRLLAPFLREAGLTPRQPGYGNWESTGLDGHMGGHYLSALALLFASTGDARVGQRLDHVLAELARCQQAHGDGYLGGIPDGKPLWTALARGELQVDNFTLNGRWVPWYNLHKVFAGLRDAHRHAGRADAKAMLIALADWIGRVTAALSDAQMQDMLRAEHGGINEVLADVYALSGEPRHLALARRFSHQALLEPLARGEDRLTGLHANTQIPKVIGFERIASLSDWPQGHRAAETFWHEVVTHRSVAIGGNSVKEHFHATDDFRPMIEEVEGPETCNSYNMLKLSALLYQRLHEPRYLDYAERVLFNHLLSSQHPETGGLVYFTPMRPHHYRVYSQVDQGMWCCVGSGLESHAKHGELIYAHDDEALYVNLFAPSRLHWAEQGLTLSQHTRFPDEGRTRLRLERAPRRPLELRLRYPSWVAAGALRLRLNGRTIPVEARPGEYIRLRRDWRDGDELELRLPMRSTLEPLPDGSPYVAVLHGPVVLAARTRPIPGETLHSFADDSRLGHIASGPTCPLDSAPFFITDGQAFLAGLRPLAGRALHFRAQGLVQGGTTRSLELLPFFRLHGSRYEIYWPQASKAELRALQQRIAAAEQERRALEALTLDQVAPGEQQPESDHGYEAEGGESGLNKGRRWRHATGWFAYILSDPQGRAARLRLSLSTLDAGRRFDVEVNGRLLRRLSLGAEAPQEIYDLDLDLPPDLVGSAGGRLRVRFIAREGSPAGGLYGLRLMTKSR